ncbi:hypothetical protein [Bradyrhizobium sp. UFLA03-84]|nr:hypothetical protein [Bradyrhizobium sp. UFLA03-84]
MDEASMKAALGKTGNQFKWRIQSGYVRQPLNVSPINSEDARDEAIEDR